MWVLGGGRSRCGCLAHRGIGLPSLSKCYGRCDEVLLWLPEFVFAYGGMRSKMHLL